MKYTTNRELLLAIANLRETLGDSSALVTELLDEVVELAENLPNFSTYKHLRDFTLKARCLGCDGSGSISDAEPGDISFNTFVCSVCKGTGLELIRHDSATKEPGLDLYHDL